MRQCLAVGDKIVDLLRAEISAPWGRERRTADRGAPLRDHASQLCRIVRVLWQRQIRRSGIEVRCVLPVALSFVAMTRRTVLREQALALTLAVGQTTNALVGANRVQHGIRREGAGVVAARER